MELSNETIINLAIALVGIMALLFSAVVFLIKKGHDID